MIAPGIFCAFGWFAILSVPERLRDVDDFEMLRGCDGELEVDAEVEAGCPTAEMEEAEGGAAVALGVVVGNACALCRRLKPSLRG